MQCVNSCLKYFTGRLHLNLPVQHLKEWRSICYAKYKSKFGQSALVRSLPPPLPGPTSGISCASVHVKMCSSESHWPNFCFRGVTGRLLLLLTVPAIHCSLNRAPCPRRNPWIFCGRNSDAIWKKHFCFFRKKLFFMTKKTWPPKKTLKKCFFLFFFIINYVLKKKER